MKTLAQILLFSAFANVFASMPIEVSLEELVSKSDHVLVCHVTGVDMVDEEGKEITDPKAMTGPALKNVIRLTLKVDEVLVSPKEDIPSELKVPLDPFMHYSLGQIKEAHSGDNPAFIALLAGNDLQPPFPGVFSRSLEDTEKVLELKRSNQSSHTTPASAPR